MSTITLPRAVVEQALEAIEDLRGYRKDIDEAITALRTALAQERAKPTVKESLKVAPAVAENATTEQQVGETPPSDYRRGYWDGFNIGKREGRIEAEDAAKQAEPVQEPDSPERRCGGPGCDMTCCQPVQENKDA